VDQSAADTDARQLIVYMPERLRARLKRAAVGSTQLYVMLDAVEKTESAGILGQLVAQHQAPDTSGMFDRRPARGVEPNVQVNARALRQHVEVLDRLATRYDTNRSELIRVALDHVLPGAASGAGNRLTRAPAHTATHTGGSYGESRSDLRKRRAAHWLTRRGRNPPQRAQACAQCARTRART
jgi:hypothetical protein